MRQLANIALMFDYIIIIIETAMSQILCTTTPGADLINNINDNVYDFIKLNL